MKLNSALIIHPCSLQSPYRKDFIGVSDFHDLTQCCSLQKYFPILWCKDGKSPKCHLTYCFKKNSIRQCCYRAVRTSLHHMTQRHPPSDSSSELIHRFVFTEWPSLQNMPYNSPENSPRQSFCRALVYSWHGLVLFST